MVLLLLSEESSLVIFFGNNLWKKKKKNDKLCAPQFHTIYVIVHNFRQYDIYYDDYLYEDYLCLRAADQYS